MRGRTDEQRYAIISPYFDGRIKMNGPYPEITNISFLAKLFFKTFISLKHVSDYRTVGLSDRRTIGLSDYRTVGLSDCRTIGLSDYSYGPNYELRHTVQIIFLNFLWSKGQNIFPTLGGQIIYFIYKNCQTPPPPPSPPPPRNQLVVPKTNQEINEPSYEMVGVKITVTIYGQNKSYFWHFFDFLFSSPTTPNVFIVLMVLKCTY